MKLWPITIRIDFPALDRLMDFLEAEQQRQIDALTEQLTKSNQALKGAIEKEK